MSLFNKIYKFSTVGLFVTLATLTTSVISLKFFKTPLILTYVIVYGSSIIISYFLNSYFTFKSKPTYTKMALYSVSYIVAMCIGILLLSLYDHFLNFENWIYPFMVLPVTSSYNFLMSNKIMQPNESTKR
jgi:putative flippase GtrA